MVTHLIAAVHIKKGIVLRSPQRLKGIYCCNVIFFNSNSILEHLLCHRCNQIIQSSLSLSIRKAHRLQENEHVEWLPN